MSTHRQTVSLPDWMWEAIDELRRAAPDEFGSRTQAIEHLLETALWMIETAAAIQRMRRRSKTLNNLGGQRHSTAKPRAPSHHRRKPD